MFGPRAILLLSLKFVVLFPILASSNFSIEALELLSRVRGTQEEKEDNTDPVKLKEDLVASAKILGKDFYLDIGKKAGFLNGHNKVDNIDNKEDKE